MNEKPNNLIPVASEAALAEALEGATAGDAPLIRDVIDVYQSDLQTMWDKIAPTLGPTVTAYVFRSIILHDDRPKGSLRRYLEITEQGISLRPIEGELGCPGSAELINELVTLFPQLCNALDSLACYILAGPPDHNSDGNTEPIGKR
ncbi:MAG: hypothetical protein ACE5I2_07645 [Anaerolineae bacterium]